MSRILVRRGVMIGNVVAVVAVMTAPMGVTTARARAGLGGRSIDPAQVVPLHLVAPERRDIVAEVIRDHTFHRQGGFGHVPLSGQPVPEPPQ